MTATAQRRAADTCAAGRQRRLPGPDVVRAVALIGVVVMNFHGYLHPARRHGRGDDALDRFFDPWTGPLSTRFAATFVLVAGVGVTLLPAGRRRPGRRPRAERWTLVRRGLVLYGGGLLFDTIWPGTILPYYGALFVVAAALFTLAHAVGRRGRDRRRARRRRRSRGGGSSAGSASTTRRGSRRRR